MTAAPRRGNTRPLAGDGGQEVAVMESKTRKCLDWLDAAENTAVGQAVLDGNGPTLRARLHATDPAFRLAARRAIMGPDGFAAAVLKRVGGG